MNPEKSSVKCINNFLSSPKTRLKGLKTLSSFILECSDETFIDNCENWMQYCCKFDGASADTELAIHLLSVILEMSSHYPELNKTVSFFITNQFLVHFLKYFINLKSGWKCAKNCFINFKGPCGPLKESIEKHLLNELKKNQEISLDVSDCIALLPCLGGGGNEGIIYKTNWKSQFVKYICLSHFIMNKLFADVEELQEYSTNNFSCETAEKYPNACDLTIQLQNHCSVLKSMLLIHYPMPKCIPVDLLMKVICRGLSINPARLMRQETMSLMSLKKVLPKIQLIMLDILNSSIAGCGSQLLQYSYLICKLFVQILDWTQSKPVYGCVKDFSNQRIGVYNAICNWLVATKSGGCMEHFAKSILHHVISDIEFKEPATVLKDGKTLGQCLSIDAKQPHRRITNPSANSCLSFSALRTLRYFLRFSGILIGPEDHKHLQETILRLAFKIYKMSPAEVFFPYSVPQCRKELLAVLLESVMNPNSKWPPPTHYALTVFKNGINDSCPGVSQYCSSALDSINVIIHQQFFNGPCFSSEKTIGVNENASAMINSIEGSLEENNIAETSESDALESEPVESAHVERRSGEKNLLKATGGDQSFSDAEKSSQSGNETVDALLESNITISQTKAAAEMSFNESEILITDSSAEMKRKKAADTEESDHHLKKNRENNKDDDGSSGGDDKGEDNELIIKRRKTSTLDWGVQSENSSSVEKAVLEDGEQTEENSLFDTENGGKEKNEVENLKISQLKSPSKVFEKRISDGSNSEKNLTPDSSEEKKFSDCKKRYFLRSKITGNTSSEEHEEPNKKIDGNDSSRRTPIKSLGRSTPINVPSSSRRPKTRAVSKLETAENEMATPKKGNDEDDDIIETFDESVAF